MLMKSLMLLLMLMIGFIPTVFAVKGDKTVDMLTEQPQCASFLNHTFRKLHSKQTIDLCQLTANKTVLIVNTASSCGYTPQFKSLEALHQKYKEQGLVIIGFPSDDFFQEKDDEKDTAKVCYINYGVTFTMLSQSAVRGSDVNPVFAHLAEKTVKPKWNFYKYLISDNGNKVQHFHTRIKPTEDKFIQAIEDSLAKNYNL